MSEFKKENTAYMKSVAFSNQDASAQVISEKDVTTGENRLRIIRNPVRKFWITKKHLRNHKDRKEFEDIQNLDMYRCPEHLVARQCMQVVNGYPPRGMVNLRFVKENQYLYGVDVSLNAIEKMRYRNNCKSLKNINIGALDIETCVLGSNQVIALTYIDTATKNVHTHVLKHFLKGGTVDDIKNVYFKEYENFKQALLDKVKSDNLKKPESARKIPDYYKYIDEGDFKYHIKVHETEKSLLLDAFKDLHFYKPDYCGGWNFSYDMGKLEERMLFNQLNPVDLFCHPDVPEDLRVYEYKPSRRDGGKHISEIWDVFKCPGYTEYIDFMSLYARLRIVKGKEISYKLDFITGKELGVGKMELSVGKTHAIQQMKDPVGYSAYNIFDVLLLIIQEIKNGDILNMLGVLGDSTVDEFASQTVQGKNNMYRYTLENNSVIASAIGNQTTAIDKFLVKKGGAVLDPKRCGVKGLQIIKGSKHSSSIFTGTSDLDVAI